MTYLIIPLFLILKHKESLFTLITQETKRLIFRGTTLIHLTEVRCTH